MAPSDELASIGFTTGCVVQGGLDGVDLVTGFCVVHDADGRAHTKSEQQLREQVEFDRRISTNFDPGSFEAEVFAERADRLEEELDAGYVAAETLADVFNLEDRSLMGPVDDPILGPQTISIQTLRPAHPRLVPAPRLPRSFQQPRRRLVRVAPRRRERRANGRRLTRAGPGSSGRPSADDDPDLARRRRQ